MKKTELMGVEISDLTVRECLNRSMSYLKNGGLNVIYFLSRDVLLEAKDMPELRDLIKEADIVLPDSIDILKAAGAGNKSREKEIERNLFFKSFLKMLIREKRSVFVVADSEEKAAGLMNGLDKIQEGLKKAGTYLMNDIEDADNAVNEINSVVPDVVFCVLKTPDQEKFFSMQKMKINSRVMIALSPDMLNVREDGTINNEGLLNFLRAKLFRRQAQKYEMDKEN